MRQLPLERRKEILNMLVEGNSIRTTARVSKVAINTVRKLLEEAGESLNYYHIHKAQNIDATYIQADEIWSFVYAKDKNVPNITGNPEIAGTIWTWTAIDAETKFMLAWLVSPSREMAYARAFMYKLRNTLSSYYMISTDQLRVYEDVIKTVFGKDANYGQVEKIYGMGLNDRRRRYRGSRKVVISGELPASKISTSIVERSNLNLRTFNNRYVRKGSGFSKRITQHRLALGLHYAWYNYGRIHPSLGTTPAIAAGVSDEPLTLDWMVELADNMVWLKRNGDLIEHSPGVLL